MPDSTFLSRVELHNYKSIAHCDVELGPLMFLVGPNGAGKSNFLDALHFVADALNTSLDQAVRQRGGIRELRRREADDTQSLVIRLEFRLPSEGKGHYELRIGKNATGGYVRETEECRFRSAQTAGQEKFYYVKGAHAETSEMITPAVSTDRLYLYAASTILVFRPIFDLLSRMTFYNLNQAWTRELQLPDSRELLSPDGDNMASVLKRMSDHSPDTKRRIEEYMGAVVSGIKSVEVKDISSYELMEFTQQFSEAKPLLVFPASSMSDGTLRTLGILVALFQKGETKNNPIPFVGIEEPEAALHPAAVGALLGAMEEASLSRQILVTTHSAEILDRESVTADMLIAVVAEGGMTKIGPIDEASRSVMRRHLFTAGELLRINQLAPEQNGAKYENAGEKPLRKESVA